MNNLKLRVCENYRLTGVIAVLLMGMLLYSCNDVLESVSSDGFFDFEIAKAYDGKLSEETRERLAKSAEKLAGRIILERDSTRTDIPLNLIDFFYNGLVHIANSELRDARQVTEFYEINAWDPADPHKLVIWFKSTPAWTDTWGNGQTVTGNSAVDDLTKRFGLKLIRFSAFRLTSGAVAHLESDRALNMKRIGSLFSDQIPEVEYSGFIRHFNAFCQPDDIEAEVDQKFLRLSYEFYFGNNFNCSAQHHWVFQVYPDGRVQLKREWGDPLPIHD